VFRSIQSKLILVYLLLILVAMQVSGAYLIKELERAYVAKVQEDLHQSAQLLVGHLSNYTVAGKLDGQSVAAFIERWPGDVLVLDANGSVIGATLKQPSHQQLIGKKFTHDDVSPALVGQETKRVGSEVSERMAFEALPITSTNVVVGVVYLKASLEEAYSRLKDIREVFLVATAVALVSTAALGIALARTITGPVREVTRKAAEMAGGNFDQSIEVRSTDEIGQLGDMFNRMTRRLKQTLAEISGEKNKVEAILAYMADGLLALDSTGRVIKLNPAALRMFQAPEAEVLGRFPEEVWPEVKLEAALAQAHAENRSVTHEIRFGSLILLAHVTPLTSERNEPAGTVVVFHDITELEKLEAMRREFVANVSHELKTPLTTVKSYVETLLDGAADDADIRSRFLRVVESETDRMARLVRDLLHLSQLDHGSANWDVQSHEVPLLVEECLARLAVPVERKQLKMNRVFQPGTPLGLFDRDKLQQVVINLLANAIEFTPSNGEITVTVRGEGTMVWVAVKDSGIGIPKEDLPRIFERFYRVDKARSRMLGGTGLGLAIARQIVELLGGAISIESVPGRGTEVTFTVPAASPAEVRWE
jgi:two-component system, OmpR family, sensor histidine kinase VicK